MKTVTTKPTMITKAWYLIDAEGKTLGRLATQVSKLLMGKNKTYYTTNLDCGDHVIVINTSKIKVTGKKLDDKMYYTYSGYQGGLKSKTLKELNAKNPTKSLELAVRGMLPKTKMGRAMALKLHLYADMEHKHEAQQPVTIASLGENKR
jgi:large subunit ribosomal protein L13